MTAVKTFPEFILSTNQNSVITTGSHNSLTQDNVYETISVIKSNQSLAARDAEPQPQSVFVAVAGNSNNSGTVPQVIAKRSSAANLINGARIDNGIGCITVNNSNIVNSLEAAGHQVVSHEAAGHQLGSESGSVFSLNCGQQGVIVGQQHGVVVDQQHGVVVDQQHGVVVGGDQGVVVGQLTANPKGELMLADLELNNQQVSYQIVSVPVTSCSNVVTSCGNVSKVDIISGSESTRLEEELTDSQGGEDLDLEVVTSTVDYVLLRNVNNGALHRSDVLSTKVSANGHVLKTVKGKGIGIVTIVDDKANVEVERGYLEAKKQKKSVAEASTNIVSLSSALGSNNPPILTTLNNPPILTTLNTSDFSSASVFVTTNTDAQQASSVLQYTNAADAKNSAITTVSYSDLDGNPLHFSEAVPLEFTSGDVTAGSPLDFSVTAVTEAVVPVAAQFTLQDDGNVVMTNNQCKDAEDLTQDPTMKKKGSKKMKRRARRFSGDEESSTSTGGNRLCQVCGGTAGRHSYYGGQVCTSCRAFFRRSVISKARFTYFCIKQGECEVTCKTRKQCQYCRYKQCEDCGMKASWVLTDGKQNNELAADKDEDEPSEKRSKDGDNDSDGEVKKLVYINENELSFIQDLVDKWEYSAPNKVNDLRTDLVKEILRMVTFGKNLTKPGFDHLLLTLKQRMIKASSKIGDMNKIVQEDRKEILEHNVPLLVKLSLAILINPNLTWDKQLEGLLGTVQIELLKEKLASKKGSDMCNTLVYEHFFSCLMSDQDSELEQEFIKVMQEVGAWPTDKEEFILISMMILFSSHSLNLKDRARIDEIQAYIGEVLHNYLNHRYGKEKGRSKFVTGVYLISRCQYLHSLSHHKIQLML